VEAVNKRSRHKRVRGKKAKGLKVKNSSQSPTNSAPAKIVSAGGSAEPSWVEMPKRYAISLYQAVLELSFVSLLLSLHTVYHVYGINLLPDSYFKKVSLALVSLLGILRILQVVKSSVNEFRGNAGKKKK
jgi:hypothetical protein